MKNLFGFSAFIARLDPTGLLPAKGFADPVSEAIDIQLFRSKQIARVDEILQPEILVDEITEIGRIVVINMDPGRQVHIAGTLTGLAEKKEQCTGFFIENLNIFKGCIHHIQVSVSVYVKPFGSCERTERISKKTVGFQNLPSGSNFWTLKLKASVT